jgi:hypothetical protein
VTIVDAVVVIVTVAVDAAEPLGVTDMGETAQVVVGVSVAGSMQLKLTVWLNPPCEATESWNVAVPPALTLAEGWLGETVKSWPVPESATLCGLPGEVSVITSVPVRVPPAVGVNVTVGAQLPPGGNAPQVFDATANSPVVVVTPVTVTVFVVLPFAIVTGWGELVVRASCGPKLTVASPVSETVCDALPSELSLTISDPYVVPAKAAVKVRLIVQLWPAGSVTGEIGQLCDGIKGLVARIPETVRASAPLFVRVNASGALVTPTLWPGKSRLADESATTGACPVPPSVTLCGLDEALSLIVSVALSAPLMLGLKLTLNVQDVLAASVAGESGQLLLLPKSPAFVPLSAKLEIVKGPELPFVRVACCAVLVVPTA